LKKNIIKSGIFSRFCRIISRSNRKLKFREDFKVYGVSCVPHDELGCINLVMNDKNFSEEEGKGSDDEK
jgi:hypothetical protein